MNETRSILLRLVIDGLAKYYPEMLPTDIAKPDYIRYSTACNEIKLDLLNSAYNKYGPDAILKIGLGMKNAGRSPLSNIFLEATEPLYLLKKWIDLEKKLDLRFRIQFQEVVHRQAFAIRHFALHGDPSMNVEDLLICGIQIALFELIGCQDTRCSLVANDNRDVIIYEQGQLVHGWQALQNYNFFEWKIEWSSITSKTMPCEADLSTANLFADFHDPMKIIDPVLSILSEDISKNWKVAEIASKLRMSKRTLQRYLNASGACFSLLTRAARINEASLLLAQNEISITDISQQCGFSDSAHFCRLFSQSTGLAPSKYRHISLTS